VSTPVIGKESLLRLVEWAGWLRARDSGAGGTSQAVRTRNCPQMAVVKRIPETALWSSFPEANRNEVLGLLSMLLERLAVAAGSPEGAGDEPGTAA